MLQRLLNTKLFFYFLALLASWPTLVMLLTTGFDGDPRFFNDATAFYCAGHLAVFTTLNPYDSQLLAACSQGFGRIPSNFFYPPPALAIFALWAVLPYAYALSVLVVGSILALGFIYESLWALYLRGQGVQLNSRGLVAIVIWLAVSQIAFMNLPYGQINLIAAAFLIAFVRALLAHKAYSAGSALALLGMCKFPFALIGGVVLIRVQWRVIVTAALCFAGAGLAAIWLLGPDHLRYWIADVSPQITYEELSGIIRTDILARDNLSLFGRLSVWLPPDQAAFVTRVCAALLVMAVGGRLYALRGHRDVVLLGLALLPAVVFLISPMSWQAYHIYLLPLDFWLIRAMAIPAMSAVIRVSAVMILCALVLGVECSHLYPVLQYVWITGSVVAAVAFGVLSSFKLVQAESVGRAQ